MLIRIMPLLSIMVMAGAPANRLPDSAEEILLNAEQIELFSIEPGAFGVGNDPNGFHGHTILGKTTLNEQDREKLVARLLKAMDGKIQPKMCFFPRHAIRATSKGKTIDLVICFQCRQLDFHADADSKPKRRLIGPKAESAFDAMLKAAKIPKAK